MSVVFLHASNRAPARAWPIAAQLASVEFAVMPGYDGGEPVPFDQDAWESRLVAACGGAGRAVVVAHSFAGPVAMRAAARHPDRIGALVLFEPAAYALARGVAEIEDHIALVQPVLDRSGELSAADFAVAFAEAVTGAHIAPPDTADGLTAAERQRRLPGPWDLDTPAHVAVPTTVVTGGWNAEYDAIARAMPGARHIVLGGYGHRPQDHPDAGAVVRDTSAD